MGFIPLSEAARLPPGVTWGQLRDAVRSPRGLAGWTERWNVRTGEVRVFPRLRVNPLKFEQDGEAVMAPTNAKTPDEELDDIFDAMDTCCGELRDIYGDLDTAVNRLHALANATPPGLARESIQNAADRLDNMVIEVDELDSILEQLKTVDFT